jgi:hypothetical protein
MIEPCGPNVPAAAMRFYPLLYSNAPTGCEAESGSTPHGAIRGTSCAFATFVAEHELQNF